MKHTVLINDSLISYLEDLSCLTLSDDERNRLKEDLNGILSNMAKLTEFKTENMSELRTFDNENVFRDDTVQASFDRELVLKNAPERNARMFIAPKTVE